MNLTKLLETWDTSKCAQTLTSHYSWSQVDSSKIGTLMKCPRKFFFNYVCGWQPESSSVHLVAGSGIHKAIECIAQNESTSMSDEELVEESYEHFLDEWRKYFSPQEDRYYKAKGPANIHRMLEKYVEQHRVPNWYLEDIEIPGLALIGEDRPIIGRLDMIVRLKENDLLAVVDHKTTGRMSTTYRAGWDLSHQMGTYLHMLYQLYEPNEIYGAIINVIVLRHEPAPQKKFLPSGAPDLYKTGPKKDQQKIKTFSGTGIEFEQIKLAKSNDDMKIWYNMMNYWYSNLETEFLMLTEQSPSNDIMTAFPMNTTACTDYNTICPYHDICSNCTNPLQMVKEKPPVGFVKQFWDPELHEIVDKEESRNANFEGFPTC